MTAVSGFDTGLMGRQPLRGSPLGAVPSTFAGGFAAARFGKTTTGRNRDTQAPMGENASAPQPLRLPPVDAGSASAQVMTMSVTWTALDFASIGALVLIVGGLVSTFTPWAHEAWFMLPLGLLASAAIGFAVRASRRA